MVEMDWYRSVDPVVAMDSRGPSSNGRSWRIGIDHEHQTALVRTGVFGLSRNPIFLGMKISLVGLFLAIPNALTALTLLTGIVLIQIQVRLEEEFLANTHDEEYCQYRQQVRRWL